MKREIKGWSNHFGSQLGQPAHDRSQPAPPPPMLRNGGSGPGCSLRSFQFDARSLRWGNVSHSARGGVNNHHIKRAQAHDRRSPLHPPVLRNGGWRGLRLTARNSTSTPLAAPRTRITLTDQPSQSQRPTAPFGRRPAGHVPAPQRHVSCVLSGCGAVTRPAFRPPPCHFAPDKDEVS